MVPTLRAGIVAAIVAGLAAPGMADLTYFDNEVDFTTFNLSLGNILDGIETFEENILPDNSISDGPAPVGHGVAWPDPPFPLIFPTGLDQPNLVVGVPGDNDRLVVLTDGFAGAQTDVIGPDIFGQTLDLRFINTDHYGISFDAVDLAGGPNVADVTIYDTNGVEIGSTTTPAPLQPQFFGVVSDVPIGHINIAAQNDGGELVDNVQMWVVPEPTSLSLMAIAALGLIRRSRRG